jgi:hypothetical protein
MIAASSLSVEERDDGSVAVGMSGVMGGVNGGREDEGSERSDDPPSCTLLAEVPAIMQDEWRRRIKEDGMGG